MLRTMATVPPHGRESVIFRGTAVLSLAGAAFESILGKMEDLITWMRRRGGVAHSSIARDAGYGYDHVRRIIETGGVARVRRSWLVLADCSPAARAAAAVGGRVTCVSACAGLGLWVPTHSDAHVVVPPTHSRFDAFGVNVHWARGPVPVSPRESLEPLCNVLFHVARCQPFGDALAVWESALRQQVWIDGHPVDALIGDRLIVQLDGFAHHSSARERERDLKADARLVLLGYTVLRFSYQQVFFEPQSVAATIGLAMAQGLHRVH